ncbi:excisionase family DNA-binding protein [Roseovarius sp. MMSF_3281]|uniref:excisionase family DNA-binding protein n=1 Tax=Roseovarius sp. MMSF_3281 TaxID=3046694 RepID=UPI00273DE25A|nr:excisionase family DNA-binding protein [Roseovarius sp. MMSF_3281]
MSIDAEIQKAVSAAVAPLVKEVRDLRRQIAPPKEWITVPEAARQMGVHESTVRRKIAAGEIETNGMAGKARRVRL